MSEISYDTEKFSEFKIQRDQAEAEKAGPNAAILYQERESRLEAAIEHLLDQEYAHKTDKNEGSLTQLMDQVESLENRVKNGASVSPQKLEAAKTAVLARYEETLDSLTSRLGELKRDRRRKGDHDLTEEEFNKLTEKEYYDLVDADSDNLTVKKIFLQQLLLRLDALSPKQEKSADGSEEDSKKDEKSREEEPIEGNELVTLLQEVTEKAASLQGYISDSSKLADLNNFGTDLQDALSLLSYKPKSSPTILRAIESEIGKLIAAGKLNAAEVIGKQKSQIEDGLKDLKTGIYDKVHSFIGNLDAGADEATFYRRIFPVFAILDGSDYAAVDYLFTLKTEAEEKLIQFFNASPAGTNLQTTLNNEVFTLDKTHLENNDLKTADKIKEHILKKINEAISTLALSGELKSRLLPFIENHFESQTRTTEMKLEGVDIEKWKDELDELRNALQVKPDRKKYGISDVQWVKNKIESAEEVVRNRHESIKSLVKDNPSSDMSTWDEEAVELLGKARELCRDHGGYAGLIGSAVDIEKKLLGQETVNGMLMALYFDGISAQNADRYLLPRLTFLKDKIIDAQYENKKTADNAAEVDRAKKELFSYIDNMYDQIGYGMFHVGNVNVETFQDHPASGKSGLIGTLNSDGSIERGLWGDTEKFGANIKFNRDVLGIRKGFDAITQRNTDSAGLDKAHPEEIHENKMQTIIAEITALLGGPTGDKEEGYSFAVDSNVLAAHAETLNSDGSITIGNQSYKEGDTVRIKPSQYNVDSLATGATDGSSPGDELVRKLVARHRVDLFKYDDKDAIEAYIRGIKFIAARNDILSTQFIKAVGTRNKSLYGTCGTSLRPFGIGCAQTRALYKGDTGGYLALCESIDMKQAVTKDPLYPPTDDLGNPPDGQLDDPKYFYVNVEKLQELYHRRKEVDMPQIEEVESRKDIFRPQEWHQGFVSRGYIACSLGTEKDASGEHQVTSLKYLDAASAMMKIIEASVKPIKSEDVSIENISGFFTSLSSQFSIVCALSSTKGWHSEDAERNPLWHINAFMISLLETYATNILTQTQGIRRYNTFGFPDSAGRQYEHEHELMRTNLIKIFESTLKDDIKKAVIDFVKRTDFRKPIEYTGIRARNHQEIRNYQYNTWLEENRPERVSYITGTWRVLEENENRYSYPDQILAMDGKKIWSSIVMENDKDK